MMRLVEDWLRELNYMPVGNQEGQEWPQTIKDAAKAMSEDQMQEEAVAEAAAPQQTATEIRSPMMDLPSTSGEPSDGLVRDLDFTVENVDLVLEEVRPYLISDGGNVKVVDVDAETRVAMLALQGACGSCPSSTTTMQLGIEKVLKENFADFGGVQQVEDPNGASLSDVTTDIVGQLLAPISPAITAMGGMVEVASAFDGIVVLKYKGSPKICSGIEMSLTANPMIREVRFIDF
ncbi:unnamed protein product [Chrysoparadoxa australica]